MNNKTIGEMTEHEARMTILRATHDALGVVPLEATRGPDGSYLVSIRVDVDMLSESLECSECGRAPAHNIHRADNECDDKEAHMRDAPDELHHPFLLGAPAQ